MKIFVSYSRVDRPFVDQLVPQLRRSYTPESFWYDDDLRGGDIWWDEILNHIYDADIFMYMLSNESVESPYCRAEYIEARRLRKLIITVQVRGRTHIPPDLDDIQYVDMANGVNDASALNDLYGAIHKQTGRIPTRRPKPLNNVRTARPRIPTKEQEANRIAPTDVQLPLLSNIANQRTAKLPEPRFIGRVVRVLPLFALLLAVIAVMLGGWLFFSSHFQLDFHLPTGTLTSTLTATITASEPSTSTNLPSITPSITVLPSSVAAVFTSVIATPTPSTTLTIAPSPEPTLTNTPYPTFTVTATDEPTDTPTLTTTASSVPPTDTLEPTDIPTETATQTLSNGPTNAPLAAFGTVGNPVPIGDPLKIIESADQQYIITIKAVYRGAESMQKLMTANPYNKPPSTGTEFLLVNMSVNYIKGTIPSKLIITADNFKAFSKGYFIDVPDAAVPPDPFLIYEALRPTDVWEGWVVLQIYTGENYPVIVFGDIGQDTNGIYFAAYSRKSTGILHTIQIPPSMRVKPNGY